MEKSKAKTILITGAADRIGAAIASRLAEHGCNIAIHYNSSADKAEKLAAQLQADFSIKAMTFQADLKSAMERTNLIYAINEKLGALDGLINNAAVFDIENDNINHLDDKLWHVHLEVNTHAPLHLSQLFARQLPQNTRGNIINLLDQRVLNLSGHFLSYTVSKAALATLTQTMAIGLAPAIRVNGIAPGMTLPAEKQSLANFERRCESNPLKLGGSTEEIANTALFFLQNDSITGQIIAVDGGEHLVGKPS